MTVKYELTVVTAPLETALSEMDCYTAVTNDSEFSVQPACSCGVIDLSDSDLTGVTGTIPSALGNCTEATQLILYNNLLTGTIPNVLSALTNLSTLIVHDNSLTGTIPLELSHLAGLVNLALYSNSLTRSGALRVVRFVNARNLRPSDCPRTLQQVALRIKQVLLRIRLLRPLSKCLLRAVADGCTDSVGHALTMQPPRKVRPFSFFNYYQAIRRHPRQHLDRSIR